VLPQRYVEGLAPGEGVINMAATAPSPESARGALKEAEAQQAFWDARYGEFLQKYPDQFVAVHEGKVVATSPDLQLLVQQLVGKGLDVTKVWLRFITTDQRHVML
jgi:hypothetical protein